MPTKKWDQMTLAQRKGLRKGQIMRLFGGIDSNLARTWDGLIFDASMRKRVAQARAILNTVKADCILLTMREEEKK